MHKKGFYERFIKRPQDFLLSLIAIIVLSPVLLIVAILVRIKLGAPVIFKQKRPGLNEKIFSMYKFRSMSNDIDENGNLLPDEQRLTKFGKLLRKSSLDELPELFNILKGDMSIIGPRPLAIQYLPYYTEEERERHSVRPGLTGLAQAKGRTALNWDDRLKYDVEYVNNISFINDCKIILLTVKEIFKNEDVVAAEIQGDFDEFRKSQLNK